MLMSKKDMKASITFGTITVIVLTTLVIVATSFFTKEEVLMQDTGVVNQIVCAQRKNVTQNIEKTQNEQKEKEASKEVSRVEEKQKVVSKSSSQNVNQKVQEKQEIQTVQTMQEAKTTIEKVENKIEVSSQTTNNQIEKTYQGLPTIGKIEIPKTKVNLPIMESVTAKGMEIAPCLLFSTGTLNQQGNTLIVGHNYNNIFTNNKKLQIGDKIYITTVDGKKIEYVIYRTFKVTPEEVDYVIEDSSDTPKIMLSTCTASDRYRLIVMAKPN